MDVRFLDYLGMLNPNQPAPDAATIARLKAAAMARPCPQCGGSMTYNHAGVILTAPIFAHSLHVPEHGLHVHRQLASFYACDSCEHCERVSCR